jgi:hypothetical protein
VAQTLTLDNYSPINIIEPSALSSASAVNDTVIHLDSGQNISANNYILIGRRGSGTAEFSTVQDISGLDLTVQDPLAHAHAQGAEITILFGDKLQLYRAINVDGSVPADTDFAAINSPASIDYDQIETTVKDPTGGSTYWYKYTFKNTNTTSETALSDCPAIRNFGNYTALQAIRDKAGLAGNFYVTNATIDEARQAAQQEVNGALVGLYVVPFVSPVNARIKDITTRLAAGLLLDSNWAGTFFSTRNEASSLLSKARADLKSLQNKEEVLVSAAGVSQVVSSTSGFSMYPDTTTTDLDYTEGGRMFRTTDRY